MTIPLRAFLPLVVADALLALWRPRVALLLPLIFHAVYVFRSSIPVGDFVVPATVLELLLWVAIVAGLGQWKPGPREWPKDTSGWEPGPREWSGRTRSGWEPGPREDGSKDTRGWKPIAAALRTVPKAVLALALVFLVSTTISAAIAPHARTAWGGWKAFVVEPMLYAVVLLPTIRAPAGRRSVAGALLLGGLVSAALSLVFGARTTDFGRLRGVYDVPNSLALVLAPLAVFAAALALERASTRLRRLARVSLVLTIPPLVLTQSIGGLVAALGGFCFVVFRFRARERRAGADATGTPASSEHWPRRALAVGVAVLLTVGALLLQGMSGKLRHAFAADSPLQARLQIWQTSLALIRDHPLLGSGLGTFEPAYQDTLHEVLARGNLEFGIWNLGFARVPSVLEWVVRDPHNVFLSFWLNTGLLGLLSMGTLVALGLRAGLRARSSPRVSEDVLPLASAAALLTLLLFGLVDVPYLKNDLSLLWWVFLTTLLTFPRAAVP